MCQYPLAYGHYDQIQRQCSSTRQLFTNRYNVQPRIIQHFPTPHICINEIADGPFHSSPVTKLTDSSVGRRMTFRNRRSFVLFFLSILTFYGADTIDTLTGHVNDLLWSLT